MLTAALDGLIARAGIAGRAARRGRRRRGAQAQPRLQPDAGVAARHAALAGDARLRRRPGVRHRPGDGDPRRQQDRPRPGRLGDRLRRRHHLRRADRAQRRPPRDPARGQQRPLEPRPASARCSRSARATSSPRSRATPSRAPASRWASTRRSWPATGGSPASAQDELAAASHQHLAAAYDEGFEDDLVTPYLGLERDQNLRPDSTAEKLGKLKPVFGGDEGTMTAGNSTPLSDGASAVLLGSEEWAAEHGLPVLARFVDAETAAVDHVGGRRRPADGARLRGAADARPQRPQRCRTSTSTRSTRRSPRRCSATLAAWEDPVFSQRAARARRAARLDRPRQAQRQGRLARRRPSVRRDRRPDRRQPGEDAGRARRRPRA